MIHAVGFYWTLPAPWAGFTRLPDGIEAAARSSLTIRYQCERIRRYAKEEGYLLIAEEVFLEIEPDRGSEYILPALDKVAEVCRAHDARLLIVDFSAVSRWRDHSVLNAWWTARHVRVETLFPDEILIDGQIFDPGLHFSDWRRRTDEWREGKAERIRRALSDILPLRQSGQTFAEIARTLNERGVPTATGRSWSADSVRKMLKVSGPDQA